jgi:hypothetical protein
MIAEALAAYANATVRVFNGREHTIGASEIGQCARQLFWIKNEGDPRHAAPRNPDYVDRWGARVRGSTFEDHFWLPALRSRYGEKLKYAGPEQRTLVSGFLSATPDGLLLDQPADRLSSLGVPDLGGDGSLVIECKTSDPRTKLDAPKPEHVFQVNTQIGLFQELTAHQPEYALIAYTDASFWDDVIEFAVKFDPVVFHNAKDRAARIMTTTAGGTLLPEGWIAGGKECNPCPFSRACGRMRTAVPTEASADVDPQFAEEIAGMARFVKQSRQELAGATVRVRELEYTIRERLRSRKLRQVAADGVTVNWSPVKGRPSYDIPAIREAAAQAGIDLSQFETTGEPSDRLTITISGAASAR